MTFKRYCELLYVLINRIVSFLPSATELLYELGAQDRLHGVTHECKYPYDATFKPRVISSVINSDQLTSKEIDEATCKLISEGRDIFMLDEEILRSANPDLIISQNTCEVCAPYQAQVSKAVSILDRMPILHSMDPHNMVEILDSVAKLGKILGKEAKSDQIIRSLEKRIAHVRENLNDKYEKILAIEWIDPFFTAGHWVPEMIHIAGGKNMISKIEERSRRLTMDEIVKSDPDKIIFMPCGFDVRRTVEEYSNTLKNNSEWNSLNAVKHDQVFVVDANSFFSKPSIRTVDGIEILAKIIQPEKFIGLKVPKDSFVKINQIS